MSRLLVSLDTWVEGETLRGAVLAEVSGPSLKAPIQVVLPAGSAVTPRVVDVPSGIYLVQAKLPSGEVISEDVKVSKDEDVPVVLKAAQSPHEWSSWHQLVGALPAEMSYEARRAGRGRGLVQELEIPIQWSIWVLEEATRVPVQRLSSPGSLKSQLFGSVDFDGRRLTFITHTDPFVSVLSFNPFDPGLPSQTWPRFFVEVVGVTGRATTIILPVPWPKFHSTDAAPVDVLIEDQASKDLLGVSDPLKKSISRPKPPRLTCVVKDELAAPLLGYLSSNDLKAAVSILNELVANAEDLLWGKVQNPYAAALGGYVLLQTAKWTRLHNWPRNLANWFPWFPDGAIIHAWQCLHEKQVNEAREYFLAAASRGIPVFTSGIRLLLDGLSMFANQRQEDGGPDTEADAALSGIKLYSSAVDFTQPFTTLSRPIAELFS